MLNEITVFVVTSPIESHPDTGVIAQTLQSIRWHLPKTPIVVLADGVRQEQMALRERYEEYIRRLRLLAFDDCVTVVTFEHFTHQVRMMRQGLENCRTPLVMFVEHDTPLAAKPIPFQPIARAIYRGDVNFVRFLPEPQIHPEHEHLMRGPIEPLGVPMMKTIQFSARPNIASRAFYERVLGAFTPNAQSFIEDGIYTYCESAPWDVWKMAIYNPPGDAQRSLHLDGRHGAPKWDNLQIF